MPMDFADIKTKIRKTTGRPDDVQIDDTDLSARINQYYQYVMPKELKIFFGYTYYTFFTVQGQDTYAPPTVNGVATFQTFNPRVYVDGFPMDWYLDPDLFFQDYPMQENKTPVGVGDGSTVTFPFNVPYFPIVPGTFYITDGTQANTAQDIATDPFDGTGALAPATSGSITYATGNGTITFLTPPAIGANIIACGQTTMQNRPCGILYYNNVFTLRDVPDQTYKVTMEGINVPKPLINPTDRPYRDDLGPLICFGTSLEIFSDYNQMDQYDQYQPQYQRYKNISMQDTYEEYLYQRSVPTF